MKVAPVVSSERISSLDILHGAALLGILAIHVIDFGSPGSFFPTAAVAGDDRFRTDQEEVAKNLADHRGGYWQLFALRLEQVPEDQFFGVYRRGLFDVAAVMILGMALLKLGVLSAARSRRFYALLLLAGYGLGLPLNAWLAYRMLASHFDAVTTMFGYSVYDLGRLLAALFLAFLARSNAGYAGVRHVLVVVPTLALLGALAIQTALTGNSRLLRGFAALAVIAALASALPVMRPWEYYNELIGGGRYAYRYFNDEGLDLGQRTEDLVRYYEANLRPAGEVPFDDYGLSKEERQRRNIRTLSWEDEEPDSDLITGTVFLNAASLAPRRIYDYAPFRQAQPVARFGNLLVYRGEFHLPWLRASKRLWRAMDLLYSQNQDVATAERLLTESVAMYPQAYPAAIELGNLLNHRGARDEAIIAHAKAAACTNARTTACRTSARPAIRAAT